MAALFMLWREAGGRIRRKSKRMKPYFIMRSSGVISIFREIGISKVSKICDRFVTMRRWPFIK